MRQLGPPLRLASFAVAAVLQACGDSGPAGPGGVAGAYVAGVVRDPEGSPVQRIAVTWEAWPAPDSAGSGEASDFSIYGSGRTDSLGRFATHLGHYSRAALDSVEIRVGLQRCWGFAPLEVRERAVAVSAGVPDTVLSLDLTLDRTAPRGRLAVGAVCAAMVTPPPFETENYFTLWIDEIGDSVRGRWDINYTESRGDDYGDFSGARQGDVLTLALRHAEPWETCSGYTVELPLEAGDSLGVGSYGSDGCPHASVPLRFVEGSALEWPGP